MRILIAFLLLVSTSWAGPVPEPDENKACPVPPIPEIKPPDIIGMGYNTQSGLAWFDFNLNGKRYVIEYTIRFQKKDGQVELSPFPMNYYLDSNRNGQFDVPGEVWTDTQGNGRCHDLELIPAPENQRSRKPLIG